MTAPDAPRFNSVALGVRYALYRMALGTHTLNGTGVPMYQPPAKPTNMPDLCHLATVQTGRDRQ